MEKCGHCGGVLCPAKANRDLSIADYVLAPGCVTAHLPGRSSSSEPCTSTGPAYSASLCKLMHPRDSYPPDFATITSCSGKSFGSPSPQSESLRTSLCPFGGHFSPPFPLAYWPGGSPTAPTGFNTLFENINEDSAVGFTRADARRRRRLFTANEKADIGDGFFQLDASDLYVAITRGSKLLALCSKTMLFNLRRK